MREDSGQSIVVVVISMALIIAVAAFAVDVGLWYEKHHQAQVTADAAALAAANYMSTGGTAANAVSYAETYASDNNLPITAGDVVVDTGAKTVAVTVPTTGPRIFAGIALGSGPSISARAVASWDLTDCAVAGSDCAFIYAGDNVCAGNTGVTAVVSSTGNGTGTVNHGVTVADSGTGSGTPMTGDVISASNLTTSVNGNPTFASAAAYETGCTSTGASTTSPSPYTAIYQRSVTSQFPIDYRLVYSACGTTSTKFGLVMCPNGYPSYCTVFETGTAPITLSSVTANAVYCFPGSGSAADPSTWTGTLTVTTGGTATFIAGTVNFNDPSNSVLKPASGNNLLAYGAACNASNPVPSTCPASVTTTTTSPAVSLSSSGNATISGDIFAPAGVIESNLGGTPSLTGFLEGWDDVYIVNGTVVGQGPQVTSTVTFLGDRLVQ